MLSYVQPWPSGAGTNLITRSRISGRAFTTKTQCQACGRPFVLIPLTALRAATGWLILNAVDHAQHELPSGYLGDPVDDLSSLREAEALVDQAVDQGVRNSLEPHLSELREAAEDWIRLRDQMRGLNQSSRNATWQVRAAKDSL
jgi:hypothetical protein